jgi:arylsulfatase A-like enzyme
LFPIQHRATQERLDLDYSFSTLAEILREDGYRTLAAVNNPILGPSTKMQQGFETWYPMWHRVLQSGFERGERHATNRVVETLVDSLGADERFFLFLNYVEPHIPYEPPPEFRRRFRADGPPEGLDPWWHRYYSGKSQLSAEDFQVLQDLYDGELAFLSHTIDDLINLLEERELLDDTLVILTSDHGENLGDHGHLDHVFNIYDTLLRVPLIILDPERPGARRDLSVTSSVDIFATILSAAGLPNTRFPSEARDLLQTSQTTESVPSIAEYYYPLQVFSVIRHELDEDGLRRMERYLRRLRSVRIDGWKLIWASDGSRELYHVLDDPDEEHNLAEQEPERVRELTALLEERLRDLAGHDFRLDQEEPPDGIDGFVGLDRDTLERLRSLGYVQ